MRRALVVFALGAWLALAACGSDDDDANEPRPPSPINVTAAITGRGLTVSPERFGAGPIVLIVSNQTDRAQAVTVEAAAGPGVRRTTSPINPAGTAMLQLDVEQGRYTISTSGGRRVRASIRIGHPRPSARDELLQP